MIRHLVFIYFIFFITILLPSCSIFGPGDSSIDREEEEYIDEEDEELVEGEIGEEEGFESESESESAEEIGDEVGDETGAEDEEDIVYIDEEDEDLAEGEIIEEDEEVDSEGGLFPETESVASSGESSAPQFTESSSLPRMISYKKIKDQPYNQAGFLVNAVYVARVGENLSGISDKIFGSSSQVSQLEAINPHLRARSVKVGDKIYYSSPRRPGDSSRLLFFFEDIGIQPSYYQAQAGENIRTLARKLLGHANSWKEIWGTNPGVESKQNLEQAFSLKYWPPGAQEAQQPVATDESPSANEGDEGDDSTLPQEGDISSDTVVAEDTDFPAPPSPPEEELPSNEEDQPQAMKDKGGFSNIDMIGGGIFALLFIIVLIAVIRKRKKGEEFDFTATNIEI